VRYRYLESWDRLGYETRAVGFTVPLQAVVERDAEML